MKNVPCSSPDDPLSTMSVGCAGEEGKTKCQAWRGKKVESRRAKQNKRRRRRSILDLGGRT